MQRSYDVNLDGASPSQPVLDSGNLEESVR